MSKTFKTSKIASLTSASLQLAGAATPCVHARVHCLSARRDSLTPCAKVGPPSCVGSRQMAGAAGAAGGHNEGHASDPAGVSRDNNGRTAGAYLSHRGMRQVREPGDHRIHPQVQADAPGADEGVGTVVVRQQNRHGNTSRGATAERGRVRARARGSGRDERRTHDAAARDGGAGGDGGGGGRREAGEGQVPPPGAQMASRQEPGQPGARHGQVQRGGCVLHSMSIVHPRTRQLSLSLSLSSCSRELSWTRLVCRTVACGTAWACVCVCVQRTASLTAWETVRMLPTSFAFASLSKRVHVCSGCLGGHLCA